VHGDEAALARTATSVAVNRMMDMEVEERAGAAYWSHIGIIDTDSG
jgi:hypothetical protein